MAYNPHYILQNIHLHVCYTLSRIAVVWNIVNVHVQSRNLFVLNFYFAPSLNLIDIIRRKMHYVQQILLYRKNCLDMSHTASN